MCAINAHLALVNEFLLEKKMCATIVGLMFFQTQTYVKPWKAKSKTLVRRDKQRPIHLFYMQDMNWIFDKH